MLSMFFMGHFLPLFTINPPLAVLVDLELVLVFLLVLLLARLPTIVYLAASTFGQATVTVQD